MPSLVTTRCVYFLGVVGGFLAVLAVLEGAFALAVGAFALAGAVAEGAFALAGAVAEGAFALAGAAGAPAFSFGTAAAGTESFAPAVSPRVFAAELRRVAAGSVAFVAAAAAEAGGLACADDVTEDDLLRDDALCRRGAAAGAVDAGAVDLAAAGVTVAAAVDVAEVGLAAAAAAVVLLTEPLKRRAAASDGLGVVAEPERLSAGAVVRGDDSGVVRGEPPLGDAKTRPLAAAGLGLTDPFRNDPLRTGVAGVPLTDVRLLAGELTCGAAALLGTAWRGRACGSGCSTKIFSSGLPCTCSHTSARPRRRSLACTHTLAVYFPVVGSWYDTMYTPRSSYVIDSASQLTGGS